MKPGKLNILITGSNGLLGQAVSKMFLRETDHNLLVTSAEEYRTSMTNANTGLSTSQAKMM